MSKNNKNSYNLNKNNSNRLQNKNIAKFFLKLALISFLPVFIIVVVLSIALKGQYNWILWLVTAVLLIVYFSVGLQVLTKKEREKTKQRDSKNKGKKSYNSDDVDIYS